MRKKDYLANFRFTPQNSLTIRFLLPNLVVGGLLAIECIVVLLFLQESHAGRLAASPSAAALRVWRWYRYETVRFGPEQQAAGETAPLVDHPSNISGSLFSDIYHAQGFNFSLIMCTYAINQFCNSAHNKLLVLFFSSPEPLGRALSPKNIGYAVSGCALASMIIHSCCFSTAARKFGIVQCYRASLLAFSISFFYSPFFGLYGGRLALWIQLAVGLTFRLLPNLVATTCSLLLVRPSGFQADL